MIFFTLKRFVKNYGYTVAFSSYQKNASSYAFLLRCVPRSVFSFERLANHGISKTHREVDKSRESHSFKCLYAMQNAVLDS